MTQHTQSGLGGGRYRLAAMLLAFAMPGAGCEKAPAPVRAPDASVAVHEGPAMLARELRLSTDVHTHLSPLSYGLFVPHMDELGIARVVNLSGGRDLEFQRQHIEVADQFGGRIALFMNIAWDGIDDPGWAQREAQRLRESVALGYTGLKVSKGLGVGVRLADGSLLGVDDPRIDPLWRAAGELGVVVAIHTADPKAFFEPPGPQNERHEELSHAPNWSFFGDEYPSREELLAARDRLVKRHRETTFMLVHFANNPEDVDYVDRLLSDNPNVVVDVAARLGEIGRHDAAKVRDIFERHRDRILFATDIQLSVVPQGDNFGYRLTLGSIPKGERPTVDEIAGFYDAHWRYFETSGPPIDHPVPIQGDWKVHPIALSPQTRSLVYVANAERIIFAPWLGRRAAHAVIQRASDGLD